MRVDKDAPHTWIKYKDQLCSTCNATCCTMPLEVRSQDLVRLGLADSQEVESTPKKIAHLLVKRGILSHYREKTGLFTITQKSNGDCYFLDSKTRLCTVYKDRPDTCRKFPTTVGRRCGFCPYTRK